MTGLEKLLQRKLPADVFKAVREALDPEDLDYVPRSRLDDVIEERDNARTELGKAKKAAGDPGKLQKDFDDLKAKYDTDIAAKDAEIKGIQRSHTIDGALTKAKAKNAKAVQALFDETALGEDLSGLEKEIERLTKSDPYLFGEIDNGNGNDDGAGAGTGANGAGSGADGNGGQGGEIGKDEMYAAIFGGGF